MYRYQTWANTVSFDLWMVLDARDENDSTISNVKMK